jgi:hypothetical protein
VIPRPSTSTNAKNIKPVLNLRFRVLVIIVFLYVSAGAPSAHQKDDTYQHYGINQNDISRVGVISFRTAINSGTSFITAAPRVNNVAIRALEITPFPKVTMAVVPTFGAGNGFAGLAFFIIAFERREGTIGWAGDDGFLGMVAGPIATGGGTVPGAICMGLPRVEIAAQIPAFDWAIYFTIGMSLPVERFADAVPAVSRTIQGFVAHKVAGSSIFIAV